MRFVNVLVLLLAGLGSVFGEEAETRQIQQLIAELGAEDPDVRREAAGALGNFGPKAAPAIPALIATVSGDDSDAGELAAYALGKIGPKAAPAIPSLIAALHNEDLCGWASEGLQGIGISAVPALIVAVSTDYDEGLSPLVHGSAARTLGRIGEDLKGDGTVLYWLVPRVYRRQLTGLFTLLLAWLALAARFPRHRPATTPKHLALMALVALVPTLTAGAAVYYATTREWAQGFIPDPVLTVLPFPVAATLSTAFVCVLAAIWAWQRKPVEGSSEPEAATGEPQPEA